VRVVAVELTVVDVIALDKLDSTSWMALARAQLTAIREGSSLDALMVLG